MDNDRIAIAGLGATAGLILGFLIVRRSAAKRSRLRREGAPRMDGDKAETVPGLTASSVRDVTADLLRQENAVRQAMIELTTRLGQPGSDQIGLSGKIAGLSADFTKLEARRRLAETDAAAIPFPGQPTIDQLRRAVGELEGVVGQEVATTNLLAKISAAIEAWKA